jgi:mono/diheme cytochrome c family protein
VLLAAVALGDGKKLYLENCASCHGKEGAGDGQLAKDLRFKPRAFHRGKFAFGKHARRDGEDGDVGDPGE